MRTMSDILCTFAVDAAREFCRATGLKLSTVSMRAVGNANFFEGMAERRQGTFITYDRAINYLMDNWPEGAVWPSTPPWPYRRPAQGVANGKTEGKQEQIKRQRKTKREENGRFSRV